MADATTYDNAIQTLEQLFVKPQSVIFNLATTKQTVGESVHQFVLSLETLSKNCQFTAVTADVYRQEYIRDAFINGLNSNIIRQRLLENNNLTLTEAFQQARTLELAQKQSDSYTSSSMGAVAAVGPNISANLEQPLQHLMPQESQVAAINHKTHGDKCWFCYLARHRRTKCPAKDSICQECGKKGHWAVVCRS